MGVLMGGWLGVVWWAAAWAIEPDELVVVVEVHSPLESVSSAQLRDIFLGQRVRAPGGPMFVPLNQPANTDSRVRFDAAVLGMDAEQVGAYWVDQRIRGGRAAPRSQRSEPLLVAMVARLPGAITYVRADAVTDRVKVLAIDGHLPDDSEYPL